MTRGPNSGRLGLRRATGETGPISEFPQGSDVPNCIVRRLISLLSASALDPIWAVATLPAGRVTAAALPAPYFNGVENAGDAITSVAGDTRAMFDEGEGRR